VRTSPGFVGEVLIVPLQSWYHASFDEEPDVLDPSLPAIEELMTDFMACKWPEGLTPFGGGDSIARFMDRLNDSRGAPPSPLRADGTRCPVISFSHFLPRKELLPEKRSLYCPPLAKAVGSKSLGERVKQLSPDLHVFGHTHYGWCHDLDGIRYLQACLAYPRERVERPFSVYCKDSSGEEVFPPLLVFDEASHRFPVYRGFWSEYYKAHDRRPDDVTWIYREPRNRGAVTKAVKRLVCELGGCLDDASISKLLQDDQ
ncbi:unnamed protein product, partial [Polarella glacialis]